MMYRYTSDGHIAVTFISLEQLPHHQIVFVSFELLSKRM